MKTSYIKNSFLKILNSMNSERSRFVKDPDKDFTRNRKCSFQSLLLLLLTMESHSLNHELRNFFQGCNGKIPSKSAIVQQREKLNDDVMPHLFYSLNEAFTFKKLFHDYHLLACDGTDINIPPMKNDTDTYVASNTSDVGYHQMHLNAVYDLLEERYVDVLVQSRAVFHEREAFITFLLRNPFPGKSIYLADRGYFSINVLAYLMMAEQPFVFRINSEEVKNSILKHFNLPNEEDFDINLDFEVTRSLKGIYQNDPEKYICIRSNRRFDFIDVNNRTSTFPISVRLVKVKIDEGVYEYLMTNLPAEEFDVSTLKHLYHLRWGIETSFRFLKYNVALNYFHSKRRDFIIQEIYARLVLYNLTMLLVHSVSLPQRCTKHKYKISVSDAVITCRNFILNKIKSSEVKPLLIKYLTCVRPDRTFIRKKRSKRFVSLVNRP